MYNSRVIGIRKNTVRPSLKEIKTIRICLVDGQSFDQRQRSVYMIYHGIISYFTKPYLGFNYAMYL